ncbi:MAG TPA: MarR family winged helix-turn-helix transcriptional regulator [Acidimicrobiales bacterium]|nr:MarR family winged helix-turn-helix transcriptional regulator [Acidimicrobiales bacterium]
MEPDDHHRAVSEVWRALVELWTERNRWAWVAGELGMSPGHAKALLSLTPGAPAPMRALADELHCDASFVTSIVDKLEERGYVVRSPSSTDRRVKTVVITEAGMRARERLEAAMYEPPRELLELPETDVRVLHRIVARLHTAGPCTPCVPGSNAQSPTKSA